MLSAKELCLFSLFLIGLCNANKYSEDLNRKLSDLTEPFRILKVNLLWQKGKQNLSEKKLADLYADLQLHDKREGDLKKLKSTGMDEDGLKAAQVEQKFMNIVLKYGLNAHYKFKVKEELPSESEEKKLPQEELKDPKLKDLWGKATASGFTDDELRTLKQELSHHQMKLDEYDTLRHDFNRYKDLETNDIDSVHFDVLEAQQKNINLKSKHRELKESMQRLEDLTSDQDPHALEFSDLRVYQLWALAKKSNMSDTELDSLREELRHFEHRLKKQEYFQEQLSLSQKSLSREVNDGEYPEHHQHLEQKVKDYDHKIKKIHTHLKTRIDEAFQKHTEL